MYFPYRFGMGWLSSTNRVWFFFTMNFEILRLDSWLFAANGMEIIFSSQ